MLTITMIDGNIRIYEKEAFTDYEWRHNAFIVLKGTQWVGVYNWECVKSVEFEDEEP